MDSDKKEAIIARVEIRLGSRIILNSEYALHAERARTAHLDAFSALNAKIEALQVTLGEAA